MAAPVFRWYKKAAFDVPALNSPQPCQHGSGCNYMYKGKPACCAFVHPGEEGTGRHLFPARTLTKDGVETVQKACVRLTGGAGYYERRRLRLSWAEWCQRQNIPYTPTAEVKVVKAVCSNCSKSGHTKEACWAPGGDAHKPEATAEEAVSPASPPATPVKNPKTPRAPRKSRAAAPAEEETKETE